MKTRAIVYTGGLGENPNIAYRVLRDYFHDYHIAISDTRGVKTFQSRVDCALHTTRERREETIFMVGCSAGGMATHLASRKIATKSRNGIAGVVLLSPAIPFGKIFITKPLLKILCGKIGWDVITGKTIIPPRDKYASLVEPLLDDKMREDVLNSRLPISGKEGRRLALFPPKFTEALFPTLHMWGGGDNWIKPSAQKWFGMKLQEESSVQVIRNEIPEAGHLLLASGERKRVLDVMKSFFDTQIAQMTKTQTAQLNM